MKLHYTDWKDQITFLRKETCLGKQYNIFCFPLQNVCPLQYQKANNGWDWTVGVGETPWFRADVGLLNEWPVFAAMWQLPVTCYQTHRGLCPHAQTGQIFFILCPWESEILLSHKTAPQFSGFSSFLLIHSEFLKKRHLFLAVWRAPVLCVLCVCPRLLRTITAEWKRQKTKMV